MHSITTINQKDRLWKCIQTVFQRITATAKDVSVRGIES